MSPGGRALLVLGLAALVAVIVVLSRRRILVRPREVAGTGLTAGIYLLTSEGCASCHRARRVIERRSSSFTEISWEAEPDVFDRLGIDAVPSVIVVDSIGTGRWYRGKVPRRPGS